MQSRFTCHFNVPPDSLSKPAVERKPKKHSIPGDLVTATAVFEPRSLRKSTVDLSKERQKRRLEEEKRRKKFSMKTFPRPLKRLTQEQLLEEAKQTEVENLASLAAYTRLEAERKTFRQKKRVIEGPVIQFHSVSMPAVPLVEASSTGEGESSVNHEDKYCRNFLTFTDTQAFPDAYFPTSRLRRPKKLFCSITGLPARYIDPLTSKPYATPLAFRIIRNKYVKEKEEKCEKRLVQLSSWLEEKKKLKLESTH